MLVTKLLKLEIVKTMRLVGTSIRKRRDAVNSTTVDVVAMTTTSPLKNLVWADANVNNRQHHRHNNNRHNQNNHNNQMANDWNHSDPNIVCCKLMLDHAVHFKQDTITIAAPVCAMYLDMEAARAIKITSNRLKNVKVNVEMYKISVAYHRIVDVVKRMSPATTMISVLINVINLNTVDAVETRITSTQKGTAPHDANDNNSQNNHKPIT